MAAHRLAKGTALEMRIIKQAHNEVLVFENIRARDLKIMAERTLSYVVEKSC